MAESHFCRPPSQPVIFSCILWMAVVVVIFFFPFFFFSCYQISSHLASSNWKPKLCTLGHNVNFVCAALPMS